MGVLRNRETMGGASTEAITASADLGREGNKGNERSWGTKFAVAIGAIAIPAAIFAPAANADEVVVWGGMGDPSGQGYENQLRATGQIGPNDTVHKVPYPASIAPLGPVTLEQSVNEGVANGRPILDHAHNVASPGERVVIRGYSEGTIPAAVSAAERSGGGPVAPGTVILDGGPVSSTGLFANQDPLVQMGLGIANHLGIPTHHRAPAGSEVRGSAQDMWAYGGQSNLGQLIPQAMDTMLTPAHAVQNPHVPGAEVWVGPDGITQVRWPGTGTGGVAPMGPTMGGPGAVAPAPAPAPVRNEDHPRWVPNSENFTAVSRDWKRNHPEQYPEFAAREADNNERRNSNVRASSSTGTTTKDNSRENGSKSLSFSPKTKAPQATKLNRN